MTEYTGKPVPEEAVKISPFADGWIYAIGIIRLLVDKEGIVYLEYEAEL